MSGAVLDRIFCKQQMDRLTQLFGFPRKPESVNAFLDALQRAFPSEHQVRLWIDDILRNERRCPVPADVYEAGRAVQPKKKTSIECYTCYDRGTVLGWFLYSYSQGGRTVEPITEAQRLDLVPKIGHNQRLYEFPIPCHCRGGNPDLKWHPNGEWPVSNTDASRPDWKCVGFETPGEILRKGRR